MPMGENGRWEYRPGMRRRNLRVRRELHEPQQLPWQADDGEILEEEYDAFMEELGESQQEPESESFHLLYWILGMLGGIVLLLALCTLFL